MHQAFSSWWRGADSNRTKSKQTATLRSGSPFRPILSSRTFNPYHSLPLRLTLKPGPMAAIDAIPAGSSDIHIFRKISLFSPSALRSISTCPWPLTSASRFFTPLVRKGSPPGEPPFRGIRALITWRAAPIHAPLLIQSGNRSFDLASHKTNNNAKIPSDRSQSGHPWALGLH